MTPAADDDNDENANVVVSVGAAENPCTGILITPQIVLTAHHCIFPEQEDGSCPLTISQVHVGPITGGLQHHISIRKTPYGSGSYPQYWAKNIGCLEDRDQDAALLYLDEPVTLASMTNNLASVVPPRVVRPTLTPSPVGPFPVSVTGPFGAAGFSVLDAPRRQWETTPSAGHGGSSSIARWSGVPWDTNKGDSGGPLFRFRADSSRDVVGILYGHYLGAVVYADVTASELRSDILANVTHGGVWPSIRYTSQWLTRHGKTVNDWWGELDYTGACDVAADSDCDGWWDQPGIPGKPVHDNCVYVANPNQLDANNDGIGDACQACPWDPDNDFDKDRICAHGPPYDSLYAVDNCPRIQNGVSASGGPVYPLPALAQANCNEESEKAWNSNHPEAPVEILGDACDPVPCADAKAVPTGVEYRNPGGGVHPQFGGYYSGRIFMNEVSTRRVAPHKKTNTTTSASSGPITQVPTYGRFCQQNEELLFRCHSAAVLRDDQITRYPSRALEVLNPAGPWLRVVTSLNTNAPNGFWPWDYNMYHNAQSGSSSSTWQYASDWNYWTNAGTIPPAEPHYQATCSDTGLAGPGTCLAGAMWFHADSPVGATQATAASQTVGIHGPELANHYFDVKPDMAYARTYSGTGLMRVALFTIRGYPYPAPYESLLRARSRPIVVEAFQSPAHVLEDHGGSWDAESAPDPLVTTEAAMSLAGALNWVSVSEHTGLAGNLDSRLQAMLVADDGTAVWDTLVLSEGKLTPAWALGLEYASEGSPFAPSPRHGFVTTLSRSVGGLFVVGGRDATTNAILKDVRLYRPALGWSTVTKNLGGGPFVAAAFSPVDQQLWVLERRDGSSATLYRVDPWTGARARIGDWAHSSTWDKHFLAVDRDGNIILVASSRTLAKSKIARLRLNSSIQAYAAQIDQEQLPYTSDAPIVDANEYGLVTRDGSDGLTGVYRRATLIGPIGTYSLSTMFQ